MSREGNFRDEYLKREFSEKSEKSNEYYNYSMTDFTKIICAMTLVNIVLVTFTLFYNIINNLIYVIFLSFYIGITILIPIIFYWYKHKLKREKRKLYDEMKKEIIAYIIETVNLDRDMINNKKQQREKQYDEDIIKHVKKHKIFYFFDNLD